jgi:hypothetical protein
MLSDTYTGGDPLMLAGGAAGQGAGGKGGTAGFGGFAQGGAGQGGQAGKAGAGGAPQTSCELLAKAHCSRLKAQCALADAARSEEGEARCRVRTKQLCEETRKLEDTTLTDEGLASCAAKIEGASLGCEERNNPLATCGFQGTRENGQPCASGAQCAGGGCIVVLSCGTCTDLLSEGEACELPLCAPGLSCQQGKCAKRRESGASCAATVDCLPGLNCVGQTCQKLPSKEGDPCPDKVCDAAAALSCANEGCVPTEQLSPGAACTPVAEVKAQCPVGEVCQVNAETNNTTCTPYRADGASCDLLLPGCEPPAQCFDGKCALFPVCQGAP